MMATWAYPCHPCHDTDATWYVAKSRIDEFPADIRIVRVRMGSRWRCAMLDRSQRVSVQGELIRDAARTEFDSCTDCQDQ